MGKIKKILCILLVCAMVIVPCSVLGSVSAQTDDTEPLTVEVTTDKSSYNTYDIAEITVNVTNTSDETVNSIVAQASFDTLAPAGRDSVTYKEVESLQPGESFSFSYKATLNSDKFGLMNFFEKLILWIVRLFNGGYTATEHNLPENLQYTSYTTDIRFGSKYPAQNIVVVGYELSNTLTEKGLTIYKDNFEYDKESNVYSFVNVIDSLNGTLTNAADVKKFTFTVVDLQNNLLDSGEIDINEYWSTTDIDFMLGKNKLSVIAEYKNGVFASETISINCFSDAYMKNLQIDTETDTDGDKLVDYLENNYTNTDVNKADTDEDGLSDYEEIYLFEYSPLIQDSDNDGIIDADEDCDLDKISNIEEIRKGLDPTFSDTDIDRLNDYDEINIYSTDPLIKDTDEDGVSDGDEVGIGTNPLEKESKFIETQEYGEITENTPISVEVSAELNGDQVGSLYVDTVTYSDDKMISPTIPGYLGVSYDFSVDGQIDSAEIVFNYDTSLGEIGDEFQPRIYYYNETTKMFEELPNQKVENGKVTAEVEHFSTYILLNKVEFDKVWETEIAPPLSSGENNEDDSLDIVFVIDYSYSMSWNDSTGLRKKVTKEFINKLREGKDKASIVSFIKEPSVLCNLTDNKDQLNSAVDSIVDNDGYGTNAGTNGSNAINTALNVLNSSSASNKFIVFLTDGEDTYTSYSYDILTNNAVEKGVTIYSIGLGTADESLLTSIATSTGGKYYKASSNTDLTEIYDKIEKETIDLTSDINDDLIPDYYNDLIYSGELVLSNGSNEFMGINFNYGEDQKSDALCADLDGDGLLNGEELIVREYGDVVYLEMVSDPCMVYSDSDEFNDYEEINNNSNPLIPSYNSEALDFFLDDSNYTYYEVFESESGWLDTISRNIWATVTLNWSHKDEAQGMVTNFLNEQSKLENIESIANETEREMGTNLAMQAIDFATEDINEKIIENGGNIWDVIDATDKFVHLKINMKKWISAGNSSKNLSSSWWTQFKTQVSLFNKWGKSWKWVSKVGSVMNYLPVVGVTLDEIGDIATVAKTYSTLAATSESFIVFEDILSAIVSNDTMDEKYVAKGVQPILNSIRDSSHNFTNEICRDISVATTENLASIAVTLLSVHNPFLIAINVIVGLIDSFWLGDISEGAYALYVVEEMVNASKSLISYENGYSYCSFEETEKIYLRFIYSSRLEGGKYAKQVVNKQIFIGEKDSEARARIGQYIDNDNTIMNGYYYMLHLYE